MYVCICYGVTDTEICDLVDAGADTPRDVAAGCGAGTGCGTCVGKIRALIDGTPAPGNERPAARGKLSVATVSTSDERAPCKATEKSLSYSTSS